MAADERSHARTLAHLMDGGRPDPQAQIRRRESWHRGDRSGALRAGVFGVSDGLVSNTALVMGFAGSGTSRTVTLLAGIAGLLAGSFSMAAGEYISMSSQREMYEREISLEQAELEEKPEEEHAELVLIYRAKGLSKPEAEQLADRIMADRSVALDTLAREELGLDPDELGSPWGSAFSSLFAFAIGAFVVIIPYLAGSGKAALLTAIVLAVAALFGVGASIGALNGRGRAPLGSAPGDRRGDRRGSHIRRRPPDRRARVLTCSLGRPGRPGPADAHGPCATMARCRCRCCERRRIALPDCPNSATRRGTPRWPTACGWAT